jgi:hypothetical protein
VISKRLPPWARRAIGLPGRAFTCGCTTTYDGGKTYNLFCNRLESLWSSVMRI